MVVLAGRAISWYYTNHAQVASWHRRLSLDTEGTRCFKTHHRTKLQCTEAKKTPSGWVRMAPAQVSKSALNLQTKMMSCTGLMQVDLAAYQAPEGCTHDHYCRLLCSPIQQTLKGWGCQGLLLSSL